MTSKLKTTGEVPHLKRNDGSMTETDEDKVNELNTYFISVTPILQTQRRHTVMVNKHLLVTNYPEESESLESRSFTTPSKSENRRNVNLSQQVSGY